MSDSRRVMLLGMDAGEPSLIREWAAAGALPNIHRLIESGLTGSIDSLPGFSVGSTWPSLYTGMTPASSGMYAISQIKAGSYRLSPWFPGDLDPQRPFWVRLSRAGRRVAVLDIPQTIPAKNLNGIQLAEYSTHEPHYGFVSWPDNLAADIEAEFGPASRHRACSTVQSPKNAIAFRDELLDIVARKLQITKHLYRSDSWDFFAQVFVEAHCAGHHYWHYYDQSHPLHDPQTEDALRNALQDVYIAIDDAIGQIVASASADTALLFVASHGMGRTNLPHGTLRKILGHLGVSGLHQTSASTHKTIEPFLLRQWQKIPVEVKNRLQPLKRAALQRKSAAGQCFALGDNPLHAGVRVNRIGREPRGKIRPGQEFEDFCAGLIDDLKAVANAGTGRPLADRVIRTSEYYSGEYSLDLPDILIEWSVDDPVPAIYSDKIGEIPIRFKHPTGHHRPDGMLVAAGPAISHGSLDRSVSILDLAPTILKMLAVDPCDFDGKVIEQLIE